VHKKTKKSAEIKQTSGVHNDNIKNQQLCTATTTNVHSKKKGKTMNNETTTSRGIRFQSGLWDEISKAAEEQKMTPADFVRSACKDKLENGIDDRLSQIEERTAARIKNLETQLAGIQQTLDHRMDLIAKAVKVMGDGVGHLEQKFAKKEA
jgi:uncharacterized coiled-coil protein SlyX